MDVPRDWWRTFFAGSAVDFWLRATTEEQTQSEVEFIQRTLQVPSPARLLDVPCGAGRHSLALAERGYQMTAVDISPAFLDVARANEAQRPNKVQWEQRDMRDLPWSRQFDGAFSFGNSFGYYEDAGNVEFLAAVGRVLKPGARFVLDTSYVAEVILPILQQRSWYGMGDTITLSERNYDPVSSRLEVEYTWIRNGEKDKRAMSARVYSYREVCQLMEAAGFTDLKGFGSLAQEPFRLGSMRLLIAGTKKRD